MDSAETKLILGTLRAAFPNFYRNMKAPELHGIVNVWARQFADEPFEVVMAATDAVIATWTESYPPTIGIIKREIAKLKMPDELSEQEAWALVSEAIHDGIYGYKTNFDKLPDAVKRSIGRPEQLREWALMEPETVNSVVASNFMRTYREKRKQQRELNMIPEETKKALAALADRMRPEMLPSEYAPPSDEEFERSRDAAIKLLDDFSK